MLEQMYSETDNKFQQAHLEWSSAKFPYARICTTLEMLRVSLHAPISTEHKAGILK